MHHQRSTAKFTCPSCHKYAVTEVPVPEPDWGALSDDLSDMTREESTHVTCNHCSVVFPAWASSATYECSLTLDDYPSVEVYSDTGYYLEGEGGDWHNYELPENPEGIFMYSHHHSLKILDQYGVDGTSGVTESACIINRMVFAHQISALEAYLGDTLLKQVMHSQKVLGILLAKEQQLRDVKVGLADVVNSPNIVRDNVREHLQGIVYHNLAKVAALYKVALKIDIWPNDEIKADLYHAVLYRHDCVHRNGRDKDGAELKVFTTAYVKSMIEMIFQLVHHIQLKLNK